MNKCFKIFLLLFLIAPLARSAFISDEFSKIRVYYKLTFQLDSTSESKKKSEYIVLYLGENISKSASVRRLYWEDTLSKEADIMIEQTGTLDFTKLNVPRTKFKWKIFKYKDRIEVFDNINAQDNYYLEKDADIDWQLHDEVKEISGYQCQKATGHFAGREYIAWFTREVPVSDGPYKFRGLPGLIVKIYDTRMHYDFELIKLQKFERYNLSKRPQVYVKTSKREFMRMVEAKKNKPIAYLRTIVNIDLTKEEEEEIIERNQKENNPIELIY